MLRYLQLLSWGTSTGRRCLSYLLEVKKAGLVPLRVLSLRGSTAEALAEFTVWVHEVTVWVHEVTVWVHEVTVWVHEVPVWVHEVTLWVHAVAVWVHESLYGYMKSLFVPFNGTRVCVSVQGHAGKRGQCTST